MTRGSTPRSAVEDAGARTPHQDPEAAYYQAVEEHFVSRRGDPLFLSNADWLLIRGWRQAGIPLRVVLRGITDALDGHAHSWSRDRKVGSLAYCATEVEVARERWQRALALGTEPGARPEAFLGDFADSLGRAPGLGPRASARTTVLAGELRAWASRLAGSASGAGALADLERWLADQEKTLLAALREEAAPDRLAELEAAVDRDLVAYRERMPPKVLEQVRAESIARRLLEAHGLGRLSLFHLA